MKRNIFLIVFVIFASTVFYKFGRQKPVQKIQKIQETKVDNASTPLVTASPVPNAAPTTKPEKRAKVRAEVNNKRDVPILPKLQKVETAYLKEPLKEYSEIKNKVLSSIPTKDELKAETQKNSHMPSSKLIQAGKELGALKSFILRYPNSSNVQKEAEQFYEQCASYTSYPNSIRSLCLYNRTVLSKNKGEKFDTSSYPPEIRKVIQKQGM